MDYLDGLRGLAALYVVIYHCYLAVARDIDHGGIPIRWRHLLDLALHGSVSVAVFIVLSGYCLMLPVARSSDGQLRGGVKRYLMRRAKRILPPYYAALLLSSLVLWICTRYGHGTPSDWSVEVPVTQAGVLSHLLLLHNLNPAWIYQLNGPLWSVATEWQIYFVFPYLLLPLWRRAGLWPSVAVGLLLGIVLQRLGHGLLRPAAPWYIGLFALGMAAASINFDGKRQFNRKGQSQGDFDGKRQFNRKGQSQGDFDGKRQFNRKDQSQVDRFPWALLTLIGLGLTACVQSRGITGWQADTITGLTCACFLVTCTRGIRRGAPSLPVRALQSRLMTHAGAFSYSLYLMHIMVIGSMNLVLKSDGIPPATRLLLLMFVGVPLALALSYLFHLAFERPWMQATPHPERARVQPNNDRDEVK